MAVVLGAICPRGEMSGIHPAELNDMHHDKYYRMMVTTVMFVNRPTVNVQCPMQKYDFHHHLFPGKRCHLSLGLLTFVFFRHCIIRLLQNVTPNLLSLVYILIRLRNRAVCTGAWTRRGLRLKGMLGLRDAYAMAFAASLITSTPLLSGVATGASTSSKVGAARCIASV